MVSPVSPPGRPVSISSPPVSMGDSPESPSVGVGVGVGIGIGIGIGIGVSDDRALVGFFEELEQPPAHKDTTDGTTSRNILPPTQCSVCQTYRLVVALPAVATNLAADAVHLLNWDVNDQINSVSILTLMGLNPVFPEHALDCALVTICAPDVQG